MKYLILFVLAMALVASIPCEAEAGPLGLFPNFRPFQRVAQRRAEGRGVFQQNGPVRGRLGSCGRGGCG